MVQGNTFSWTTFYSEFADKLLPFKNNRPELLRHIKDGYDNLGAKYPFIDNGELMDDICPFTVFGCFNKGITDENRIALMRSIGSKLSVKSNVPTQFNGIPVLNNFRAWFFGYKKIEVLTIFQIYGIFLKLQFHMLIILLMLHEMHLLFVMIK